MERPRIGKHHAVFPRGYSTSSPLFAFIFGLTTRSQRARAFFFELPHSRLRTAVVARYYHRLAEQLRDGDLSFARVVSEDATGTLFSFGTYTGREDWKQALNSWRESWTYTAMELLEFVNPPGSTDVFLRGYVGGLGAASGLAVEETVYGVIRVEDGQAVLARAYRDRAEALEAAGLRDRATGGAPASDAPPFIPAR
ncbi:MAG TPA: hypothetical protein VHE14_01165 [Solirubrobacteraceae bacterium]|nr:hypothetical protein [Solirubrobacteraceae bacterium]